MRKEFDTPNELNYFNLIRELCSTDYLMNHRLGSFEWTSSSSVKWPLAVYLSAPDSETIDCLKHQIQTGDIVNQWLTSPASFPAQLNPLLIKKKFVQKNAWPAMFLTRDRFKNNIKSLSSFIIKPISLLPDFQDYARIIFDGSGNTSQQHHFANMYHSALNKSPDRFKVFLGYFNGKKVCTGMFYRYDNIGGIYWINTLGDYRRQGFGSLMTSRIVNYAFENSCDYCVLHATAMGKPVYQKLGFQTAFSYEGFSLIASLDRD